MRKRLDMCRPHTAEELEEVRAQHTRTDDSTTDNFATTTQMTFLARMFQATGNARYRDGIPRKSLEEIGRERRNGYSWYNNNPAALYETYGRWADRYDPAGKVDISLR